MRFNCHGHDPFEINSKFHNNFPSSVGCKFAIGVYSVVSAKEFIPYTLEAEGRSVIRSLPIGTSHNLSVYPFEEKTFHYHIHEAKRFSAVNFVIVALSGECNIYFSFKEQYPDG